MVEYLTTGPASLRRSPLQHLAQDFAAASDSGSESISLREVPFLTQIGLRAVPGSTAHTAFAETTGVGLPGRVGQVTGAPQGVSVLWLGPDEFLVVTAADQHELTRSLHQALGESPGQVVDLSASRTVIELAGAKARAALEKGVPADLHPREFPIGTAVTTTLGPVPILLWRTDENVYRVMPRTSFAEYTARWLIDALCEYRRGPGAEIRAD